MSVSVSPASFSPGSSATVTLTLHNAGPATAGSTTRPPHLANLVLQKGFRREPPLNRPPYAIPTQGTGCFISYDIVGPLADLSFGWVWSFYFELIPAGESRTCTFPIQFYPTTTESFETFWVSSPLAPDPNPGNDRAFYTFVAGTPYVAPTPVPALAPSGLVTLILALMGVGAWRKQTIPVRPSTAT